jgi:hypothetical protein
MQNMNLPKFADEDPCYNGTCVNGICHGHINVCKLKKIFLFVFFGQKVFTLGIIKELVQKIYLWAETVNWN